MIAIITAILLISTSAAIVLQHEVFGKTPNAKKHEKIRNSPNFKNGKFRNPVPTEMNMDFGQLIKEYWNSSSKKRKPQFEIPVNKLATENFASTPSNELKMIWFGHSSVLLEMEGKRIFIDPVLSESASPFEGVGVKRLHAVPLEMEKLPAIDFIVISHNHYDHLDYPTIKHLARKYPETQYLVPLGVGASLELWGVAADKIHELDWHESVHLKDIDFIATPARHFTNRSLFDRDKTLWASFVIKGKNNNIFYSGDSGMFPGFKDIGDKYGPFDLSLMGIGAYNKMWHAIHTFPEEAAEAHLMLRAKKLMPVHWATFDLAIHPYDEPIEKLLIAAEKMNIELVLPEVGEVIDIASYKNKGKYWWRGR